MSDYYDKDTGEEITNSEAHDRYDVMLDQLGDVTIGGLEYSHSNALKRVDAVAYRCGFSDWSSEDMVESGYWVRVLTEDCESHRDPKWMTDEDEAREHAADIARVDLDGEPSGVYYVQVHDTSDDVIAELRVEV